MSTRESVITSMCFTMRHDYGLQRYSEDGPLVAGMSEVEREALRRQMAQLYDNCIAHCMEFKRDVDYEKQVNEHFKNMHQYSE